MNRKIKFSVGEYYHIYNRGVDKRDIFMDKYDYDRFLLLLKICNSNLSVDVRKMKRGKVSEGLAFANEDQALVDIGVWCLMPNHFHMLVTEKVDGGISLYFQKLLTAYSMYFNGKYERKGSLFQGRFQAKHANTDNYLKYLYSYIHLNPVKLIQANWREKGLINLKSVQNFLEGYKYSSYLDYSGRIRDENNILNTKAFPEYFESRESFQDNLSDWLHFNPDILDISTFPKV